MLRFRSRRNGPERIAVPVLLALLAMAGGAAAAQPAEAPATTGPRIEVEQREIDLGSIVRGEAAEARFALHNRGDKTANVLRVKPG